MTSIRLVILLTACLVIATSQALAFDGDRHGFMIGLGAGSGTAETEFIVGDDRDSVDESGIATTFMLGGGVHPKALLYYLNRAVFYTAEDSEPVNGLSGVGMTYFLSRQAPSFFINGGVGFGAYQGGRGAETEIGDGFTVGVGFEFINHWTIEASYLDAKIFSAGNIEFNIYNVALTVNVLLY